MRTLARAGATAAATWSGWLRPPPRLLNSAITPVRPADTLAKLTWSIQHTDLPDWAERIGRSTLVIIDEAGMADTLTLDTAVQFIIGRGGSIRLIGDDQQLAAIGAGGVLRDIQASYGAVRLTELHRFTDPAEAAASIAVPRRPTRSARLLPGPATRPRRRPHHTLDACLRRLASRPQPWSRFDHAGPDPRAGRRAQPTSPRPPPRVCTNPEPGGRAWATATGPVSAT